MLKINLSKKFLIIALTLLVIINSKISSFSASVAGQEMRTQVLILADIIENDNDMNNYITRKELSKMLVKSSEFKDSASSFANSSIFFDVPSTNEFASYIKIATKEGYMTSYLGGNFRPDDAVLYKDLIRSCLSLLGYTNEDFTGNQTQGRYQLFSSLKMDTNIDKNINDYVTKKDCVNALYNTLKTSKKGGSTYGPSVFEKMSVNNDGELNASGLIKTRLEGPFVLKRGGEALNLAIPFSLENANIFINGSSANLDQVMRELNNFGYLIYYFNETTKTLYIYKEGTTLDSDIMVRKGTVNHIYYSASDTITPTSVEIDLAYYSLANSETKFAFSYAGTLQVGDQIIFIYNKTNQNNEEISDSFETEGSITFACLYDLRY